MFTLSKLIAFNTVRFLYYKDGELWYEIVGDDISPPFVFPIPVGETGNGKFPAQDKAGLYLRWIRAQYEKLKGEKDAV